MGKEINKAKKWNLAMVYIIKGMKMLFKEVPKEYKDVHNILTVMAYHDYALSALLMKRVITSKEKDDFNGVMKQLKDIDPNGKGKKKGKKK